MYRRVRPFAGGLRDPADSRIKEHPIRTYSRYARVPWGTKAITDLQLHASGASSLGSWSIPTSGRLFAVRDGAPRHRLETAHRRPASQGHGQGREPRPMTPSRRLWAGSSQDTTSAEVRRQNGRDVADLQRQARRRLECQQCRSLALQKNRRLRVHPPRLLDQSSAESPPPPRSAPTT